jgi:CBS domain containing-hemolysin-like protein
VTTPLFFLLAALAFGVLLNGIRIALSFYQKDGISIAPGSRNPEKVPAFRKWIEEARLLWNAPGFFESLSVGRFAADAVALCAGANLFSRLPGIGWWAGYLLAAILTFIVSHWGASLLAKAYAPSLGGIALAAYRAYAWLLMGRMGRGIHCLNESLLRRLGRSSELDLLGANGEGHPEQEGESLDRTGLEKDEREMIRSILDLRETQAKEIMTPRVDMVTLEIGATFAEVMELVTREKFSRIPVYEENLDAVRGILHIAGLMALSEEARAGFRLAEHLGEAYFVPRTKKIGELMREFRRKQVHMAIVVDEYGGVSGLVTLEDILEEIVGEIHDEDEVQVRRVHREAEGQYRIDPVVSLFDLKEELGIDLRPEDEEVQIDTLGGYILYVHGRVPAQGDVIRDGNLSFEILEMDGNKIEGVRMKVKKPEGQSEPEK